MNSRNKSSSTLRLEDLSYEFIPYACHYDKDTILTKAGEMLQVIKVVGFTYEVLKKIDLRTTLRNAISQNIKQTNFSFWIHTVRTKQDLDPGGNFPYFFARGTHEAWCKKNYWHDKYVNELYITIVYRDIDISVVNFRNFLSSFSYLHQKKRYEKKFSEYHNLLNKVTNNILLVLQEYGAQKLTILYDAEGPYSEQLQFFGKIIHLQERRMAVPMVNLAKYLATHKIAFGNTNFEIKEKNNKQFGVIFSVKEYHEVSLGELDKFLQLPQEMVITQSVNFINSKKVFKKFNYQKYILEISGDTEFSELSGLENMLKDLDDSPTDFGNSQLTIMIHAGDLDTLDQHVQRSVDKLSELGVLIVKEDLNLENCFWSQLPANFSYLIRNSPINSKFVGGFASLYNFPAGRIENKWGKAVTLFRTALGTPYFFNFHFESNGHTCIIGPRGSGKNTLINFLISESCKYSPRILILDYNNRTESLLAALGRSYIQIESLDNIDIFTEDIIAIETNSDQNSSSMILSLIQKFNDSLNGKPTIIVIHNIDIIKNIININEWLEFLKTKNTIAIISIDQIQDNFFNEIKNKIATQIFLPHDNIDQQEKYCLSDNEFILFKSLQYINRHFLIKQGHDAIVAELNLSGLNDILAILSNDEQYQNILKEISHEKKPDEWLPNFYAKIL